MPHIDTRMGGAQQAFPETLWTSILNAQDPDSGEHRARLDTFLSCYWKPVFAYVRASWGKSVEDAKDATQDFFCHLVEKELVSRYQPAKGRFRYFLKAMLKNFLSNAKRSQNAQKRGGGVGTFSLDVDQLNAMDLLPDDRQLTPEEIFDRQWADDLLSRSLDALKSALLEEGRDGHWKAYELYELGSADEERRTYEDVAARLGIAAHDVKHHLIYVRARFHEILIRNISDSVTTQEEIAEEIAELFSG